MLILGLKFNKYLKWAIALMIVLCVCHDTGSGHVPFGCSLDEEFQDANLWASCPAVLTKTPNQIKLVIPKASAMAHTLQSTVCAGEVEPQRRRLACWMESREWLLRRDTSVFASTMLAYYFSPPFNLLAFSNILCILSILFCFLKQGLTILVGLKLYVDQAG